MALLTKRRFIFVAVLILAFYGESTRAHESCCKHKLLQEGQQEPEYIDDPNDFPPFVWEGQPQYIDDPNDTKPEDWDDEDDGDWAPIRILNPSYTWKPQQIPNPHYVPPPTYWDKLRVELLAATPWVTLGVLITGVLSVISLPFESLLWLLQTASISSDSLTSWFCQIMQLFSAALLGLATPLCSCGALPLCAGMLKQGIPFSSVLVFLTASQSAGLDSAAITYGLLGAPAMLGRLLGAIILAMAVGLVCSSEKATYGVKRKSASDFTCHSSPLAISLSFRKTLQEVVSTCLETATEIYPTVWMGIAIGTAALHYLPSLMSYASATGTDGGTEMCIRVLLLVSSVPLQLCEHTSVTLAAAIQKAGGSPGLAFAFLLSAPATNLPCILWMWNAGHGGRLPFILMALCGAAVLLSYALDASQVDLLAGEPTGEMAKLPSWLDDSSPYLAGTMVVAGWYQDYRSAFRVKPVGCCAPVDEKAKAQ